MTNQFRRPIIAHVLPLLKYPSFPLLVLFLAAAAPGLTVDKLVPFTTDSSVRIDLTLSGDQDEPGIDLRAAIVSPQTREVIWSDALGNAGVAKGQPTVFSHKIEGIKARPWSPASPSLYILSVQAQRDGKTIDTKSCRIGFRSFVARDGQFLLNGKPIFLKGLAINPPGRSIAPAIGESRAFAESYVKCLRDHNVNIIRLEHDSQAWFDVCDEQGMMIYQGAYGSPPESGDGKREPPADVHASIAGYRKLFETYAAHPSIVIDILSNELPYTGTRGRAWHDFLTEAHKQLSQWDPTHPYIGNAGYGQGHEGDINDIHRYWGWYYNSFLTYYNLRDPHLFGDYEKNQPLTFSECVGCFTGPSGQFNRTFRKQLGAQLEWTGHSPNQRDEALSYQSFMLAQAIESFRRLRPINPRLAGLMPFTIPFFNYAGVTSFDQMHPKPALDQMRTSYQPVLLSWECWTPQLYAGAKLHAIAHVINDAENAKDLKDVSLEFSLLDAQGASHLSDRISLAAIPYYGVARHPIELPLPDSLETGDYKLLGIVRRDGKEISKNQIDVFIAGQTWKEAFPKIDGTVPVFDPTGATIPGMKKLGISCQVVSTPEEMKQLVRDGRHVLCFDPAAAGLDSIEPLTASANDPTYPPQSRPTRDGMYINLERPGHPVLAGLDRRRFRSWSDDTAWDQTKPGFPNLNPVTHGFRLKRAENLSNSAILADYDRGLEGVALCEIFNANGSVIVSAFDFANRAGVDPVADKLLINLAAYTKSPRHELHPLIDKPILWGDYATEHGVITGPSNGLVYNCRWVPTETNKDHAPVPDNAGSWNELPGDQFISKGVRPFGPFAYSTATTPRDLTPESQTSTGFFYAAAPSDRTTVLSKVENPTRQPATITVTVNGSEQRQTISPDQTTTIRNALAGDRSAVEVKYSGPKDLVILETSFEK